jgi:hypothetical protein
MKLGFLSKIALGIVAVALAYGAPTESAHAVGFVCGGSAAGIFDADRAPCGNGTQEDWGIPGVGRGTIAYSGTVPAYGFEVSFAGVGDIDANSIAIGNAAGCIGSTGGGTTFCTIGSPNDIWEAFQTGPKSIDFLAQNSNFFLSPGQQFFVNVFFTADPMGATFQFIDTFSPNLASTPLPSTWLMLLCGMMLLGYYACRGIKNQSVVLTAN